jgi:hypothetical protein
MIKKIFLTVIICMFSMVAFAQDGIYTNLQKAAVDAGVPTDTAELLASQAESAGFTAEQVDACIYNINSMYTAGAISIADKILEGIAKNVDAERIIGAVVRLQARYESAMNIVALAGVSNKQGTQLAGTLAEAMTAGASQKNLENIAKEIALKGNNSEEYATETFGMYRDMARHGVIDKKAFDIAMDAVIKNSGSEIGEFRRAFSEEATYANADDVADMVRGAINAGMTASAMKEGMYGGKGGGGSRKSNNQMEPATASFSTAV